MLPKDMQIIERTPTVEEFNRLRDAVGWGAIDEDVVRCGLSGSLYSLCLVLGDEVIGCVRLVGDGALKVYVEELIIDPRYQGRGFGTLLMERLMGYIHLHYRKGCAIGLFSNTGLAGFYSRFGFTARPEDRPGMQIRI